MRLLGILSISLLLLAGLTFGFERRLEISDRISDRVEGFLISDRSVIDAAPLGLAAENLDDAQAIIAMREAGNLNMIVGFPGFARARFDLPNTVRARSGELVLEVAGTLNEDADAVLRLAVNGKRRTTVLLNRGSVHRKIILPLNTRELAAKALTVTFSMEGRSTGVRSCGLGGAVMQVLPSSDGSPALRLADIEGLVGTLPPAPARAAIDTTDLAATLGQRQVKTFSNNARWRMPFDTDTLTGTPQAFDLALTYGSAEPSDTSWLMSVFLNDRLIHSQRTDGNAGSLNRRLALPQSILRRSNVLSVSFQSGHGPREACAKGTPSVAELTTAKLVIIDTPEPKPLVDLAALLKNGANLQIHAPLDMFDGQLALDTLTGLSDLGLDIALEAAVDSTPRRFAEKVPVWRAPTLMLLFSVFAFGQLWLINSVDLLNATFQHNDFTFAPATGGHAIPLRIFMLSFLAAFGLVCDPRWWRKLSVSTDMIATYALYCLLMDVLLQALFATSGIIFSLHVVEIASGLVGFVVFSFKLLEHGKMPSRIPMDINNSETRRIAIRLIVVTLLAAWFAWTFQNPDSDLERFMRSVGLLGGIGPGVFLFLPAFFMLLYLGAVVEAWLSPKADFTPDLTVFVPAHNEAYIIADTIAAMDKATLSYGGNIKLLVMNNASSDETQQVAQDALDRCKALTGEVIDVPKPGKANALNAGLDAVETEYCVRVDADTLVEPEAFTRAMRHFADPTVGVVGGLPVPPGGGFFDRARFLEVAVKHGFYSVAFATINSVVGIPGMFSVYRTHLPRDLGGFVEGMNGEDTDISDDPLGGVRPDRISDSL